MIDVLYTVVLRQLRLDINRTGVPGQNAQIEINSDHWYWLGIEAPLTQIIG